MNGELGKKEGQLGKIKNDLLKYETNLDTNIMTLNNTIGILKKDFENME